MCSSREEHRPAPIRPPCVSSANWPDPDYTCVSGNCSSGSTFTREVTAPFSDRGPHGSRLALACRGVTMGLAETSKEGAPDRRASDRARRSGQGDRREARRADRPVRAAFARGSSAAAVVSLPAGTEVRLHIPCGFSHRAPPRRAAAHDVRPQICAAPHQMMRGSTVDATHTEYDRRYVCIQTLSDGRVDPPRRATLCRSNTIELGCARRSVGLPGQVALRVVLSVASPTRQGGRQ